MLETIFGDKTMLYVPAKVAVAGLGNVGKTTLCRAIMGEDTTAERVETAGLQYHNWSFEGGSVIFFDFGGQEMWDTILRRTIQRLSGLLTAKLILMVFDVSTKKTFKETVYDLNRWIDYFEEAGRKSNFARPVLFVGNKIDCENPERIEKGGIDVPIRELRTPLMDIMSRIASPNQTHTLRLLHPSHDPRERFEKNVVWVSALYYNRNEDYRQRMERLRQEIIAAAKQPLKSK